MADGSMGDIGMKDETITIPGYKVVEQKIKILYGCPVRNCSFDNESQDVVNNHLRSHRAIVKSTMSFLTIQENHQETNS